jgi:hypothetical protein
MSEAVIDFERVLGFSVASLSKFNIYKPGG